MKLIRTTDGVIEPSMILIEPNGDKFNLVAYAGRCTEIITTVNTRKEAEAFLDKLMEENK